MSAPEEDNVSEHGTQAVTEQDHLEAPQQASLAVSQQVVQTDAHLDHDDLITPRQATFNVPQPYGFAPTSVQSAEGQHNAYLSETQQNVSLSQASGANDANSSTQFSSSAEANSAALGGPSHPIIDPTIPTTEEAKRGHVATLMHAMASTERAEDNPGMIKPFQEGKYSARRIELTCWEVLEACISRQHNGAFQALCDVKSKPSSNMKSFYDRFQSMVEALTTQKTICKHLLDPAYLYTFVDDPVGSQKRVLANKNLNKKKGQVMNAGKQALSANHSPATSISSNVSGISNISQLDDPFAANPAYTTPQKQMSRASSFAGSAGTAGSPDSETRQAFSNMGIGSHHASPLQSGQIGYVPNLIGPSPFNASGNLREGNFGPNHPNYGQYVSSDMIGPQRHHVRQLSGPQPGFRAVFNTGSGRRSHSNSASVNMAPAMMAGNTLQRQVSGTPSTALSSTPGSRKRSTSSREDVDMLGSPQKKQHK